MRALITGVTGQDGSYLAEFLLQMGYEVHGLRRRNSISNSERIENISNNESNNFFLHDGDVVDALNIYSLLDSILPHEIYHLAAQSHVGMSFEIPYQTINVNVNSTLHILEWIRQNNVNNSVKFYHASTSEIFGNSPAPQSEFTKFAPVSPYGVSKLSATLLTQNYRQGYGIFASNGILFNHESPRRGPTFVSQKIVNGLVAWKLGKRVPIMLGNLLSRRDWGHASEYVQAMWKILQFERAEDFVIGTEQNYSVLEFIEKVANELGLALSWSDNFKECYSSTGEVIIKCVENYKRAIEVDELQANASKAKTLLGWQPKISIDKLVEEMCERSLRRSGH